MAQTLFGVLDKKKENSLTPFIRLDKGALHSTATEQFLSRRLPILTVLLVNERGFDYMT